MEFKFNRGAKMAPLGKPRIHRIRAIGLAVAGLALSIAWLSAARADDLLDRRVHFEIAGSPLSTALIEFSAQSGLQVAAADGDVAQRHSNGLNGTYPIHTALSMLLDGTGLEFTRVGDATLVIRGAPIGPTAAALARAGEPRAAPKMPVSNAAASDPDANGRASPDLPDVTVTAPRPPTDEELAGDSVYQFILHHATAPYPASTAVAGSLTRWRGDRPGTVCPLTVGLSPDYDAFVSARLRALAANVGAPVDPNVNCKDNVRIVFTSDPEKLMDGAYQQVATTLGVRIPTQPQKLLHESAKHAIQGWYLTAAGGARISNADAALLFHRELLPLWPLVIQTGLRGAGCCYGGIVSVVVVVDTTKIVGIRIGPLADYIAMISLSLVQSPDHCDPLPSILDLMSSSCGARERPTTVTAGDLAFLRALYLLDPNLRSLSRDEIEVHMMKEFKGS